MENLPRYADLPVVQGMPPGSSWGLWGAEDKLGCLNLLTEERVLAAAREVQKGSVFPLNLDMSLPAPPMGGRPPTQHRVIPVLDGLGHDDEYNQLNPQASSQIDGFAHAGNPRHGFYNGLSAAEHSVHHWAERGLVGRGVMVDMERWRREQGRPLEQGTPDAIGPDELLAALESQGSTIEPGDLLVVYTGFLAWYRGLGQAARDAYVTDLSMPGLARGTAMVSTLWDLHPSLVASDNLAVEVFPPPQLGELPDLAPELEPVDVFLHLTLIPLLGIPLGELWDLERLAADCAADGRYSFCVTSAVMNQRGGVASMANATAIK